MLEGPAPALQERSAGRPCALVGSGGPSSLRSPRVLSNRVPRFGDSSMPELAEHWQEQLEASIRMSSPGRGALKVAARSLLTDPQVEPLAGSQAPAARGEQACRGPHGRAPSSGGRARASARTMTRSPLPAAPSQPAGKAISHSGRQSPAAQRFVPRGPGPLSLALITLSRLTARPAAPRTPGPRRPPHNGSGNRLRRGPR